MPPKEKKKKKTKEELEEERRLAEEAARLAEEGAWCRQHATLMLAPLIQGCFMQAFRHLQSA
jgi:hypothetical protein